jgi:hypothetical protein
MSEKLFGHPNMKKLEDDWQKVGEVMKCPKCGSNNTTTTPMYLDYQSCNECGYRWNPEQRVEIERLKKENQKLRKAVKELMWGNTAEGIQCRGCHVWAGWDHVSNCPYNSLIGE